MVADKTKDLTEDEAAQYDRQIRLWGLESQKLLRETKVLIIGLKGFGTEIAKNIILSGVKSVTFLDNEMVCEDDASSQFFCIGAPVNTPRGPASVNNAQKLNPNVKVTADTGSVAEKSEDYFHGFDVVIATECPLTQLVNLNTICHEQNIKFICGDVYGVFGFFFIDVAKHAFLEPKFLYQHKEEPNRILTKKQAIHNGTPLQKAVTCDAELSSSPMLKKMNYCYFLMKVLFEFRSRHGRKPEQATAAADIEELKSLRSEYLKEIKVDETRIPEEVLSCLFAEVSPVCAIVGGVLADEFVKIVCKSERALDNFFFLDPGTLCGYCQHFPPKEN